MLLLFGEELRFFIGELLRAGIVVGIIYAIIKVGITYATRMQEIAEKKGYKGRVFGWCFWLPIHGGLMVNALPDERIIEYINKEKNNGDSDKDRNNDCIKDEDNNVEKHIISNELSNNDLCKDCEDQIEYKDNQLDLCQGKNDNSKSKVGKIGILVVGILNLCIGLFFLLGSFIDFETWAMMEMLLFIACSVSSFIGLKKRHFALISMGLCSIGIIYNLIFLTIMLGDYFEFINIIISIPMLISCVFLYIYIKSKNESFWDIVKSEYRNNKMVFWAILGTGFLLSVIL